MFQWHGANNFTWLRVWRMAIRATISLRVQQSVIRSSNYFVQLTGTMGVKEYSLSCRPFGMLAI